MEDELKHTPIGPAVLMTKSFFQDITTVYTKAPILAFAQGDRGIENDSVSASYIQRNRGFCRKHWTNDHIGPDGPS